MGSAPAVWLGRHSYSIYLVHWPLIVLWKIKFNPTLGPLEQAVGFVLSILLGALLHRLIEAPFRFHRKQTLAFRSGVLAGVMALTMAILVTGAHFWALNGLPSRIPEELQAYANDLGKQWDVRQKALRTGQCNFMFDKVSLAAFRPDICVTPPPGKKSLLIIGDSFGSDAYLVMERAFPEIYFGQVTIPGCQLQPLQKFSGPKACRELYDLAINQYAKRFDGIVLSSNWPSELSLIEELMASYEFSGRDVILIGQHIRFADRLPSIISTSLSRKDAVSRAQGMVLPLQYEINGGIKRRFADRTVFIDFMQLQCPEPGSCTIFDAKGRLMYLDDSHLSVDGASVIAQRLRATYGDLAPFDINPPTTNTAVGATSATAPAPNRSNLAAQRLLKETQTVREAAWKKLWKCNTFEFGRKKGEIKYKLLQDLDLRFCLSGQFALFVDSTAVVAVPPVAMVTKSSDLAILSSGGCQFVLSATSSDCFKMNKVRSDVIAAKECGYKAVFIAMNWRNYSDEAFNNLIGQLKTSSCRIVMLSQLPHFTDNPSQLIATNGGRNLDLTESIDPGAIRRQNQLLQLVSPNIEILDVSPLGGPLPALAPEGKPIYLDKYHYTQEGINWLMHRQAEKLADPE